MTTGRPYARNWSRSRGAAKSRVSPPRMGDRKGRGSSENREPCSRKAWPHRIESELAYRVDFVGKYPARPSPCPASGHVHCHALPGFTLVGQEAEVRTIAYSPDGRVLASGLKNGQITLWELKSLMGVTGTGAFLVRGPPWRR